VPKQFCGFGNGCTLLDETLQRIAPLVPPAQTTVVVDRAHDRYLERLMRSRSAQVLHQPCDRGTAAGVLFGMLPALRSARDPTVLLTPSDHGVLDTAGFRRTIARAVASVASDPHRIILFGAQPCEPDGDYGWISPDVRSPEGDTCRFWPVASFVEKPTANVAAELLATGAVWNTMVVVARASALAGLYRRGLPDLMNVFDAAQHLPPPGRDAFLAEQYPTLVATDFCRDLLMRAEELWVHVWPAALGWSDLGTPRRLRRWISVARQLNGDTAVQPAAQGTDVRVTATRAEVMS